MYVCVCNGVTDRQIRAAADDGASTLQDLQDQLKVATCCGRCAECAESVLETARRESRTVSLADLALSPSPCPA